MGNIKKKGEYILKHSTIIQFFYKNIMSAIITFLGLFLKTDKYLILFNSFGGRKFNDSPRVLFDAIANDVRFSNFKLIWAFEDPDKFIIPRAKSIKIDSLEYFITALKAKVWISSVNIERGLHFKKQETIYINTWHGAGTKKIGNACNKRNDYDFSNVDLMLVQSEFEREIFLRDFICRKESIYKIGFPRNDELFHITFAIRKELRKKFLIPEGKKVILYAPTWRDSKDGGISYEFLPPFHIEKWKEELSSEYVILFRMHTLMTKFEMEYDDFVRNVSEYDNLNHILAITDILVTDYSTIIYDSSIVGIPFVCFGFDYDTYKIERGFYYDLDTVIPGGVQRTEDEVLARINEVAKGTDAEKYRTFREKYIEAGGNATEIVLDELEKKLQSQVEISKRGKPI